MKILLTGSKGQLGHRLQNTLVGNWNLEAVDIEEMDLLDEKAVRNRFQKAEPDLLIHPAAYTQVDLAETQKETAHKVNVVATGVLAEECAKRKIPMIYISTDFVFDGTKQTPYTEEDEPNPLSVYGATKLDGEKAVISSGVDYLIFRTSWVYGAYGKNFYNTIKRLAQEKEELKIVNDQIGVPTTTGFLSENLKKVLEYLFVEKKATIKHKKGIYHLTCAGSLSWYDFAKKIVEEVAKRQATDCRVLPIPSVEYPTPAKRPAYSVLDNQKIVRAFGIEQKDWVQSLVEVVNEDESLLAPQPTS